MASQSVKETKSKKAAKTKAVKKDANWESRAVLRLIEAGSTADCPHCLETVSFKARQRDMQVICNIYNNGVWEKVEQFHKDCYKEANNPYGKPQKSKKRTPAKKKEPAKKK